MGLSSSQWLSEIKRNKKQFHKSKAIIYEFTNGKKCHRNVVKNRQQEVWFEESYYLL